jgi:DNA polymerase-3 subunit gamma/tau
MSYQVLARKWRPQRFDDVVGQLAVTRTLRNALTSGRLAQAFVFAGPRGVGKTTTARILARALSCASGPTPDPCGTCDACVEIAEGRDIDVLEIDAATHTGIDNVREVIISGLAIMPVRDRYKIFIIDEVHQLSTPSFNALLKSIEEPPPHVVFMMATTELDKIPETVLSRSQVYEFRTISTRAIADQLRRIADAEHITVADEALQLIARDAEGSMRDAQSKLDQVIAFTGQDISTEAVSTVLGLVGRDLLLDAVQAVADEDAPAAFALTARAVEMGYDLRLVCRELARVVRDLLILNVDRSRASDPEIAAESERDRLIGLAQRFSREDLLRAFDLLTRAEADLRAAAQPRYHLEMALLRWIYLRKLVPIEDLIAGAASGKPGAAPLTRSTSPVKSAPVSRSDGRSVADAGPQPRPAPAIDSRTAQPPPARDASTDRAGLAGGGQPDGQSAAASFKDALLAEIRKSKFVFYNTVVAQAQKIDVDAGSVTFLFSSTQRALRDNCDQNRSWLEQTAAKIAGRPVVVRASQTEAPAQPAAVSAPVDEASKKSALRQEALADAGVQALLEVFPAEIRDIEEM